MPPSAHELSGRDVLNFAAPGQVKGMTPVNGLPVNGVLMAIIHHFNPIAWGRGKSICFRHLGLSAFDSDRTPILEELR